MVPEAGEAVGERRLRKPRELGFTCALDPSPVADEAAEDDERREEAEAQHDREPDELRELDAVGRPVVRAPREDCLRSPGAERDD